MAGSLAHIVADDGTFHNDLVETYGDKDMALIECHQIIAELLEIMTLGECHGVDFSNKSAILRLACKRLGFPVPTKSDALMGIGDVKVSDVAVPIIQPDLHGSESVYRPAPPREWFIWSEEHNAWWRPNSAGYTGCMAEAGRYTFHEADKIVRNANEACPLPGKKFNEQMVRIPRELL
jgi:hypothetical protein